MSAPERSRKGMQCDGRLRGLGTPAVTGADHIAQAYALFGAWSSGDPDAPRRHLHADAVLDDVIGGVYHGWPAIRAYFQRGLERYPDLTLVPTGDFWRRDGRSCPYLGDVGDRAGRVVRRRGDRSALAGERDELSGIRR